MDRPLGLRQERALRRDVEFLRRADPVRLREDQRQELQQIEATLAEHERLVRGEVTRLGVMGATTDLRLDFSPEEERSRVVAAIGRAKRENIVKERSLHPGAGRSCVLMPTLHYGPCLTSSEVSLDRKLSQAQLFQFCYYLQLERVRSPFFEEGRIYGGLRQPIDYEVNGVSVGSPEGQEYLSKHPKACIELMDSTIEAGFLNQPGFSDFTAYEHIQGPHDRAVYDRGSDVLNRMERARRELFSKYAGQVRGTIDITVDIVGYLDPSRRPLLRVRGVDHHADAVVTDCERYLALLQEEEENTLIREGEFVRRFVETPLPLMPMGAMGVNHRDRLLEGLVREGFTVHVVTPLATFRHASGNECLPTDPAGGRGAGFFQKLREMALTVKTRAAEGSPRGTPG